MNASKLDTKMKLYKVSAGLDDRGMQKQSDPVFVKILWAKIEIISDTYDPQESNQRDRSTFTALITVNVNQGDTLTTINNQFYFEDRNRNIYKVLYEKPSELKAFSVFLCEREL